MHKNNILPLLCSCRLFIYTGVSKNSICLKIWFFTSFDITWYAEAATYTKKIFFFLSFYSFLVKFSELNRGSDRIKLIKCNKVEWGEKCGYASDILFEWPHVLFVICHLPFVISINGSIKMLKNSWISKNFKNILRNPKIELP